MKGRVVGWFGSRSELLCSTIVDVVESIESGVLSAKTRREDVNVVKTLQTLLQ